LVAGTIISSLPWSYLQTLIKYNLSAEMGQIPLKKRKKLGQLSLKKRKKKMMTSRLALKTL
jgi:hypothetical protein